MESNDFSKSLKKCLYCFSEGNLSTKYQFRLKSIYECYNCKILFTYPQTPEHDLVKIYNENYYSNQNLVSKDEEDVFGYDNYIEERFYKQNAYLRMLREIEVFLPKSESRKLLDIGCGYGYFLDVAHDRGFEPVGVELNKGAINYLKKKFKFSVIEPHEIKSLGKESFDIISMLDLIEHLHEPKVAVQNSYSLLKPQGLLIITTVDSNSLVCKLFGKRIEDFRRVNEHFFFFNRKLMKTILEEYGFEVLATQSLGHTFELGNLSKRLSVLSPILKLFHKLLVFSKFDRFSIYFNPHVKYLMLARKRPLI